VFVISHPEEKFYSFTQGIVSRYFTGQEETGDATMMSITADFGPGSSGCPIFNDFGAVIGMADNIVSTTLDRDDGSKPPSLLFKHCRPSMAIQNFVKSRSDSGIAARQLSGQPAIAASEPR
jgi:S1-C subfamily serine protease